MNPIYVPAWIGFFRVRLCIRCGSLVKRKDTVIHTMWHDHLRRAVEEGEFLE